jgi:YesN/AraC family two-component response regulator
VNNYHLANPETSSGMNNYLAKPVRAATIKALLESYLNKGNEEKDMPNLATQAKNMVKQALTEANNVDEGGDGGVDVKQVLDRKDLGEVEIRSRPPSLRKVTAQRIRPNGEEEDAPPS